MEIIHPSLAITHVVIVSLPCICSGLHDEVEVVSALPPAAGVGEVHLPSILRNIQVIHKGKPSAANRLPSRHQGAHLTFSMSQGETVTQLFVYIKTITHKVHAVHN